jgi:hypothetical protein
MSDVATRAQVEILARILHTEPAELAFLEEHPLHQVAQLVSAVSDDIFDELAAMFRRVSKLAPLVPNAVVASVAQRMVTPLVAGRAAGALGVDHPDRIVGVLSRLEPGYMAACAPYLDPRAVKLLAPRISADLLLPAGRVLLERREYAVAARFVEFATHQLIVEFEKGLDDDAGLLRTAALVVDDERLNEVIRVMPEARVERILLGARADEELAATAVSMASRLDDDLRDRFQELLPG